MALIEHKKIYDDSKKVFTNLTKEFDVLQAKSKKLTETNKALASSLQLIKKTSDGAEAKKLVEVTDQLIKSTSKLKDVKTASVRVEEQILKANIKLVESQRKEAKSLQDVRVEQQRVNKENKEAAVLANKNISLYQKESIRLNNLRKAYKELALQNKQNTTEGKKLLANLTKLDTKLKSVDNAVGQNQRSVGKYTNALKGMGTQLVGALGITAGITMLIDQFKKASERISTLTKLTNQLKGTFDLTTKGAQKLAIQMNAMAENFEDVDAQSLQTSLTAIVKTFDDITEQEALNLIQEGFQKGSNNSGEFLDILKEYPVQFKAAGIDAKTMFAIINQQVKQGIYSDKGVDAIKEGGLRLRKNTKAVQEALTPFDDYTKQQIKLAIESGNSFEAIQLVSKGLTDTKLTASETQAIIADVFGGAGEDAGIEYIKMLQNIDDNLDNVKNETTGLQDANLKLTKSYNTFLTSIEDGNGLIAEASANAVGYFADMLDGITKFSEANVTNKLKLLANGFLGLIEKAFLPFISILETLGIEVPKFRFEIEETTKAIEKNTAGTAKSVSINKKEETVILKLTAAQKKRIEREKELLAVQKDKELLRRITATNKAVANEEGIDDSELDDQIALDEKKLNQEQKFQDDKVVIQDSAKEQQLEREIEQAEVIEQIKLQAIASGSQLASDIFANFQNEKLATIASDADAEKKILQDKLDKGLITEEEFAAKSLEIDKRVRIAQAKADKKKAIFDIFIATAIAVAKLLATPLLIPAAIATGAIQAASVAARPIPKFAKGTEYVEGKGTSTSDSVHAMLSKGERVVPTEINQMLNGIPNSDLPKLVNNDSSLITSMALNGLITHTKKTNDLIGNLYSSHIKNGFLYIKNSSGQEFKHKL